MKSKNPITLIIIVVLLAAVSLMIKNNNQQPASSLDSGVDIGLKQNKIFLMGGGDRPNPSTIVASSDGYTWQTLSSSTSFPARISQSVLSFNNKLYVFGGYGYNNGSYNFNDVWQSANGKDWTQILLHAPWGKRSGNGAVVFQNKLWMIGGETYNVAGSTFYNDMWSSENGKVWKKEKNNAPWNARSVGAMTVFDNKIWLIGGGSYVLNSEGQYDFTFYHDVWSFDGSTWTQEVIQTPWSASGPSGLFVLGDMMYVIVDDGFHSNMSVWSSPNGKDWSMIKDNPEFPNYNFTSFVFDNKMWIAGGSSNETPYGGVWSSSDGATWTQESPEIKDFSGESHPAVISPR